MRETAVLNEVSESEMEVDDGVEEVENNCVSWTCVCVFAVKSSECDWLLVKTSKSMYSLLYTKCLM